MSEKIIDELLKDAPPGQVKEVLKDVKTLVGDDAKVDNVARKTIREYYLKHLTHATYKRGGKSHSLLLSKHAETKPSSDLYYDPATGLCVRYDHLEQRAEALEGEEAKSEEAERMRGDEAAESRRKAVETHGRAELDEAATRRLAWVRAASFWFITCAIPLMIFLHSRYYGRGDAW